MSILMITTKIKNGEYNSCPDQFNEDLKKVDMSKEKLSLTAIQGLAIELQSSLTKISTKE